VVGDRAAPAAWSSRGASGRRSAGDQRHRSHAAIWGSLARLPGDLWPVHDDLQPLQPLEPAGGLERDFLCADGG
jgi:transposase